MGKSRVTYQVAVGVVAVFLGHGQVHRKRYTVRKDGQEDDDFKRSVGNSLESYTHKWWITWAHNTKKQKEKKRVKYEQYADNFLEASVRILPFHNTEASLAERISQCQEEERVWRPWVAACGHQLFQLFLLFSLQCFLIHDVGWQWWAVAVHHCCFERKVYPQNSL